MSRRQAEAGTALHLTLQALAWPQGGEGHRRRLVLASSHQGLAVDDGAAADGGRSLHQLRVHLSGFPLLGLGREQQGRAGFCSTLQWKALGSELRQQVCNSMGTWLASWRHQLSPSCAHLAPADSRAQERLEQSIFLRPRGRWLLTPFIFHLHFLDLAVFSRRWWGWRWRRRVRWRRRRRRHFQRQGRLEDRDRGLKQSPKWSERHERRSRDLA